MPAHSARTLLNTAAVPPLAVLLLLGVLTADPAAARASSDAGSTAVVVEVFVRDDCPHCAAAKRHLAELQEQHPAVRIVYRPVDRDAAAREDLIRLSNQHGIWPPGVPSFVAGNDFLVGFHSAEHSGPRILAMIETAAVQPASGNCTAADPGGCTVPEAMAMPFIGQLSVDRLGLPLFTLVLGLLDGFNPCAMWVLLFLLALLVRLHDRRRMLLVAGTFVLASGAVYYAFMAAWLNVFLAVGMTLWLRLLLGVVAVAIGAINVKDFIAFGRGPTLSIPESARPGLYARMRRVLQAEAWPASLIAVTTLAVMVNFVELLCTAGIPAVYTAVLTQQGLSLWAYYAYLGLYILGYIADDSLMVAIAVITLGSRKLTERGGRWLKLISGAVMLVLGAVLILRPDWLV